MNNNFFYSLVITAFIFLGCSGSRQTQADVTPDAATVKSMVENKNFVFVARSVSPMTSRRRELTSGYQISILKDSIISYLPFFGRGYTAPVSPADIDFDFTSTKFSYATTPAKNGWNILIKPTDQKYLQKLYFRVFENGTASLIISSIDRSSISYSGYIKEKATKK